MTYIKDVPTLKGDNYGEWRKKVDLAFICAEVDWVLSEPKPKEHLRQSGRQRTVMLNDRKSRATILS